MLHISTTWGSSGIRFYFFFFGQTWTGFRPGQGSDPKLIQNLSKSVNNCKNQSKSTWSNLGMSILILVSNGDVQRSFRACIQGQSGSGQIQIMVHQRSSPAKNNKFGPKWVENRRFGLKFGPNESHGPSGPSRTTPGAQNQKKSSNFCLAV